MTNGCKDKIAVWDRLLPDLYIISIVITSDFSPGDSIQTVLFLATCAL